MGDFKISTKFTLKAPETPDLDDSANPEFENTLAGAIENAFLPLVIHEIKEKIESMTCPFHGAHPTIEIDVRSFADIGCKLQVCCEKLKEQVEAAFR